MLKLSIKNVRIYKSLPVKEYVTITPIPEGFLYISMNVSWYYMLYVKESLFYSIGFLFFR